MSKEKFPSEEDLKQKEATTAKSKSKAKSAAKADSEGKNSDKKTNATAKVEKQITDLQAQNKELEDKFLRSQAEMQNMQTRYNNERTQLIKYESQSLAKDVLPAVDNLERALATKVDDDASQQLKRGVQMTLDSLVKALKDHGISEIEAENSPFDPTLHQAVQTVTAENDDQKDHVVQVLQKGYQYKDRTLRPAMVVVAQ
ncbi:nucleotide exchange factor GrpE [Lactobacillus sp. ESL0684]|uniref:nucleotide exchange factor GrpE n=1 Tax=Lactobacillus sp. ESL0684 TaxID=2983213 RepID=UPI0023FA4A7E|nr:nucleotide exchange factor GrpE [Lactobacillus sp. ESL0684]WEV44375.1 nucleotide exchange factor GrpE [Lactobacillus sp. ESL0684]